MAGAGWGGWGGDEQSGGDAGAADDPWARMFRQVAGEGGDSAPGLAWMDEMEHAAHAPTPADAGRAKKKGEKVKKSTAKRKKEFAAPKPKGLEADANVKGPGNDARDETGSAAKSAKKRKMAAAPSSPKAKSNKEQRKGTEKVDTETAVGAGVTSAATGEKLASKPAQKADETIAAWARKRTSTPGYSTAKKALEALWAEVEANTTVKHSQLVKVEGILPPAVADAALAQFEAVEDWDIARASNDAGSRSYGAGTTQHTYGVSDGSGNPATSACIAALTAHIEALLPGVKAAFQASRYSRGHFIEPHDDVALKDFDGQTYRRAIACILYMNKGWDKRMGGAFVDHHGGVELTPGFNTLVAFRVPRLHEVTPVTTDRFRHTIFGWFYLPHARQAARNRKKRKKQRAKKSS